ncbi:alpha-(1,3)-fucosyltransferase fut-1-like [Saccostrea cucullata]|uniref:alpha-(1,3)-fucosyltransferase fut-1-like n=1 Tax=Saccostrea cuccullata TaxID=36930 RepID=UPI002ED012C2
MKIGCLVLDLRVLLICGVILWLIIAYLSPEMNVYKFVIQNEHTVPKINRPNSSPNSRTTPLKTLRTFWVDMEPYIANNLKLYNSSLCNIPNCLLADNISSADIVVFSHRHIPRNVIDKKKGQIWIFFSGESPYHTARPTRDWIDRFDLSMSYMKDSDIQMPIYGVFQKSQKQFLKNYSNILKTKTKDAVWLTSHCKTPSRRENLVKDLGKYLSIDIFGECGDKKCGGRYEGLSKCLPLFETNYKFYFSFENSICNQYTTEKLHSLYLEHTALIPVINGPKDATQYIPKGTYINSQDFTNAALLAYELKQIGSNETEYIRYLKEKDKYTTKTLDKIVQETQCNLCKYLVDIENGKKARKNNSWVNILNPGVYCTDKSFCIT